MKFKRLVAGGLAGAAVVTLGVLPPSEASADDISGCPSGRFCVWEDAAYSGRLQVFDMDAQKRISVHDFGVSSYWNRTGYALCAITVDLGQTRVIGPDERNDLLDADWNDRFYGAAVLPENHFQC